MPIRAPDKVTEHRLTLGKKEFQELNQATEIARQNVWLDAIPNIGMGVAAAGVAMAGYAVLRWSGMSLSSLWGGLVNSEFVQGLADPVSDVVVNAYGETNLEKMIEKWYLRIIAIRNRMRLLETQREHLESNGLSHIEGGKFHPQYRQIIDELVSLSQEESRLYEYIENATAGNIHYTGLPLGGDLAAWQSWYASLQS